MLNLILGIILCNIIIKYNQEIVQFFNSTRVIVVLTYDLTNTDRSTYDLK